MKRFGINLANFIKLKNDKLTLIQEITILNLLSLVAIPFTLFYLDLTQTYHPFALIIGGVAAAVITTVKFLVIRFLLLGYTQAIAIAPRAMSQIQQVLHLIFG